MLLSQYIHNKIRAFYPKQRKGQIAEAYAAKYLRQQGIRILFQNYRCKLGEIDLIGWETRGVKKPVLVFFEVKYRQKSSYGGAVAALHYKKQQKITRAAFHFLQRNKALTQHSARFDLIAIEGQSGQIQWLKNAFQVHDTRLNF